MTYKIGTFRLVVAVLLGVGISACATQNQPSAQVSDPLESLNRAVFTANSAFNQVVTFPLARSIEIVVPQPLRQGVSNGTANLNEPTIFVNNLLQGRFSASVTTFGRFLANSTLGAAGVFDIATLAGLPRQTGDFGQTLFVWGIADSPYIVMPFLGPATIRDAIGFGVDSIASPGGYAIYRVGGNIATSAIFGLDGLRRASELQVVDDTAIDPYVRLRSVYYQNRRRELLDGIGRKDNFFDPASNPAAPGPSPVPAPKTSGPIAR
ncbi:MAG: VacJ family lipoprotein [Beijerinckiaceae bacterium]